ncbi:hypothetical protein D3C75_262410 [compost metagenome]
MEYSQYSELIDCIVGDSVYVYRTRDFEKSGAIDENMIGTIESMEQETNEEWDGMQYLTYKAVVKMKDGEIVTIKDDGSRPFFRKYEFITLKDLRNKYNIEIA